MNHWHEYIKILYII